MIRRMHGAVLTPYPGSVSRYSGFSKRDVKLYVPTILFLPAGMKTPIEIGEQPNSPRRTLSWEAAMAPP